MPSLSSRSLNPRVVVSPFAYDPHKPSPSSSTSSQSAVAATPPPRGASSSSALNPSASTPHNPLRTPSPPPTPSSTSSAFASAGAREDAYRAALLLARWNKRASELQIHRGKMAIATRSLHLYTAFSRLRLLRALHIARWSRGKSAELHAWRSLMRLVLRAWRGWHAVIQASVARNVAAIQSRADRLCAWCLGGWMLYVRQRWNARGALLHLANTLQRRCLRHWAAWLTTRRSKRPERSIIARRAVSATYATRWISGPSPPSGAASRCSKRPRRNASRRRPTQSVPS